MTPCNLSRIRPEPQLLLRLLLAARSRIVALLLERRQLRSDLAKAQEHITALRAESDKRLYWLNEESRKREASERLNDWLIDRGFNFKANSRGVYHAEPLGLIGEFMEGEIPPVTARTEKFHPTTHRALTLNYDASSFHMRGGLRREVEADFVQHIARTAAVEIQIAFLEVDRPEDAARLRAQRDKWRERKP